MKSLFKTILQYYLKLLAKLVLAIHRPTVIAIAGSTNKSFIRKEIFTNLKNRGLNVWANEKSFNTEIGLPLSILRLPSGYGSYRDWLPVLRKSLPALWQKKYPAILVLELGVSKKDDMKYLLSLVRPKISIISDITQRYLEGFEDMDKLITEYDILARYTGQDGTVILNYDNRRVRAIAKHTKAKVEFFGTEDGASWQAIEIERGAEGEMIRVKHKDEITAHQLNSFGRHNVYAKLAGLIINEIIA